MTTFTREDFEHAARAVGLTGYAWSDEYLCMVKPVGYAADSPLAGAVYTWDPRYDDGDALRLAVTLGLVVDCSRPSAGEPFKQHHVGQVDFQDQQAATRHAIFRAAIAIGKATP